MAETDRKGSDQAGREQEKPPGLTAVRPSAGGKEGRRRGSGGAQTIGAAN